MQQGRHSPAQGLTHIALIGNSMPRQCGIATFTTHCYDALHARFPDLRIDRYAMDDGVDDLDYPADVTLIAQHDRLAYSHAAKQIEESGAQAIWLQHEFGIFGGAGGDYILHLLARTRVPVITTLHTILARPGEDERRVMDAILARSTELIVMAERGREILRSTYGVDDARIHVIEHGVPDRPYVDPDTLKPRFGWQGRKVVLTFGLLAPDKGIESMIRAMPAIIAAEPETLYVVLGATHPNIVREQGEALRNRLMALSQELHVADHVRFIGSYIEQEELLDYLQAADIYVTPYVNPAQITSGTLSYAVAMGKPVVSTPYIHATEILADDHGRLVPFGDSAALADNLIALLADEDLRRGYATRAYQRGRGMLWAELARRAQRLLVRAHGAQPARLAARRGYTVLPPTLSAILRMSDGTGMLQHSIYSVPDRNHGYCIDDNARALILLSQIEDIDDELRDQWMATYSSFVQHGWNDGAGRFRNFMAYDRSWCEDIGSQDSSGRALWSVGVTARDARQAKHRDWACILFDRSVHALMELSAPRARAFAMLGAAAMLERNPEHRAAQQMLHIFGRSLFDLYGAARRPDWDWFEPALSYDNMRLCEAMIRAGMLLGNEQFLACGLDTLRWAAQRHTAPDGHFRAVGTESFGRPYAPPLTFDQQPLEAQAAVEAARAAFDADPVQLWVDLADNAYGWFLGRNDLDLPIATREDGGCYDGLTPHGVNRNQGAESLLALQLSSCAIIRLSRKAQIVARTAKAGSDLFPA